MNLNQLALNHPTSPYDSTNASQTSLTSSLQQQRGIPRLNGASNQFSPMHSRPVPRAGLPPRQAPQIAPPGSRSGGVSNPTANTPTKGEPWAFPEDPEVDDDDMGLSSPTSSRHASLASSSLHDHGNYSHASLQPRSVTSLQSGDSIATTGNYSRTPELRVSHKLAERKRRSEMKDLFDQLNTILPNSPGNKSSKWEVLTKGKLAASYTNWRQRLTSTQQLTTFNTYKDHQLPRRRKPISCERNCTGLTRRWKTAEPTTPSLTRCTNSCVVSTRKPLTLMGPGLML